MGSIKAPRSGTEGESFHAQIAVAAAKGDGKYFPLAPDASLSSYYTICDRTTRAYYAEFDPEQLEELLRKQWGDRPELLDLIPGIVRLYRAAEEMVGDDGDGDVSSFIYEMF